jgi:adenylate cyclase
MITKTKLPFIDRISVRITFLILIILSIGIGTTIFYYLQSQNESIIASRERAIKEEGNVLYTAIKNNMLAGEAPIAVSLFQDFAKNDEIGDIKLFRADGVSAFSDNKTLHHVNKILGESRFKAKSIFLQKESIKNKDFIKSSKKIEDVFVKNIAGKNKELIIFKPLLNQPKCSKCHGLNHVVRGVIRIASPVNRVYSEANKNILISIIIYGIVVIILSGAILLFFHRFIITRIFKVGEIAKGVGKGDFKTKITLSKYDKDEIGELSQEINEMIDGLHEKFKLSKFVSKSTLEHVKGNSDIELGGEKSIMTVLFSDIRGFTSFSETRDPREIMIMLNKVMNLQGEIINEFGGDIDKFVGDEIMAVFHGEDMVLRAAKASFNIIKKMKEIYNDPDNSIYIGIGINTGDMISGNMGTGDRMDRTVLGDSVNLGARLCSAAGKNTIVISEYSYDYIKDSVIVNKHEPIKVKGKSEKIKIYSLRGIK